MSKREKPTKIAQGRYMYKGYKLRCHGACGAGKGADWEAVQEDTDTVLCKAASLHELVRVMDETIKG